MIFLPDTANHNLWRCARVIGCGRSQTACKLQTNSILLSADNNYCVFKLFYTGQH